MADMFEFFLGTLSVAIGVVFVIVATTAFMDRRARRQSPGFPHPPDAASGLFGVDTHYILKLRDGEKIGPIRFEGYGMKGDEAPLRADQLSFRKPDDRRVIVDGFSIRTAEEVAAPGAPAPTPTT